MISSFRRPCDMPNMESCKQVSITKRNAAKTNVHQSFIDLSFVKGELIKTNIYDLKGLLAQDLACGYDRESPIYRTQAPLTVLLTAFLH